MSKFNSAALNRELTRHFSAKKDLQDYILEKLEESLNAELKMVSGYKLVFASFKQYLEDNKIKKINGNIVTFKNIEKVVSEYVKTIKVTDLRKSGFQKKPTQTTSTQKKPTKENTSNRGGATTAMQETLSMYFILAYNKHQRKDINFYTQSILQSFSNQVKSEVDLNDIFQKLDRSWWKSSFLQAEKLNEMNILPSRFFIVKDGYGVSEKFNRKISIEIKSLPDLIPSNTNINKWNTSDIWIVKTGTDLSSYATGNLFETNQKLIKAFNEKKVIGVSLKKVAGQTAKAEFTGLDNENKKTYRLKKIRVTTKSKAFSSLSGYYLFSNGSDIHCNMKNNQANWSKIRFDANEPGTAAGAGGAADTHAFNIAKRTRTNIPQNSDLAEFSKNVWKKDEKTLDKLYKMISKFDDNYKKETLLKEIENGQEHYIKKKSAIIFHLHEMITENTEAKVNEFLTDLMNFIMAKSEWSGPFVKIY